MKAVFALFFAFAATGHALTQDIKAKGHHRKDGAYAQPHFGSATDGIKSSNYQASRKSGEYLKPRARDYDLDGEPIFMDLDNGEDGVGDDFENIPDKDE
jgi:hypothetical protein